MTTQTRPDIARSPPQSLILPPLPRDTATA